MALVEGGALQNYALLADNVTMVFVELPIFIRCADDLFSDEDLAELGIPVDRDRSFWFVVTGDSGSS